MQVIAPRTRRKAALLCALPFLLASAAWAAEPRIDAPTAEELQKKLPEGASLTGRDLYDRFLKNRRKLRTAHETARITSRDPGGNPQETRFVLSAKDYRDAEEKAVEGVLAKTIMTLTGPHDIGNTGYLHVHRDNRADDQYAYTPSNRRIQRISLKGQTLAGTDFSFDDFLVNAHDIEDADYVRLPDETVGGVRCYVVDVAMKPAAKSTYTRAITYLEPEHYVPLRTRYFEGTVEVKVLTSPRDKIKEFDGAWIPTESTMTDVREQTSSTLHVDVLDPNPKLEDDDFNLSRLVETRS